MKAKKTVPQRLTVKQRKHLKEMEYAPTISNVNFLLQYQRDSEMYCAECDRIAQRLGLKGYYERTKSC